VPVLCKGQRVQPIASSRSAAQAAAAFPPIWLRDKSTIAASRACAPATNSPINAVSGMFFQYFLGISFSIAPVFSRAGLKMEA
jgi:hypothetical protein